MDDTDAQARELRLAEARATERRHANILRTQMAAILLQGQRLPLFTEPDHHSAKLAISYADSRETMAHNALAMVDCLLRIAAQTRPT